MIINKEYVLKNTEEITQAIMAGKIFIYPTDTIYGIGCNALDERAVAKIREIKQRETKPFSVIAPSMAWIQDNFTLNSDIEEHLGKFPGPYTLFLKLKRDKIMPKMINPLSNGTLGVRIPRHWFTELVAAANVPFITTSVNISGAPYMTSIEDLDETIKNNVHFIIYEGEIRGTESIKIDLTR